MEEKYHEPVYTIGIAAKLLDVCMPTLRIWEKKGLITPARIGKNRYYSKYDMDKLEYIKNLLQEKGINIEGVKAILGTKRCWDIKKCSPEERAECVFYREYVHKTSTFSD